MNADKPMGIGALSKATGVNIETIRYYERIGLLVPPDRTPAGYRQYTSEHLRHLAFIRKGRELGFQIEAVRTLLRLAEHPETPCEDVDHLTEAHLTEIERKIAELEKLRDALRQMSHCHGRTVAECKIIDALAS